MVVNIATPLRLECAETHSQYTPHPADPLWAEAQLAAESIHRAKIEAPTVARGIHDRLVDSLVSNTLAIAKRRQRQPEPMEWTPPQRCVWRSAKRLPTEQRWQLVCDRSVTPDAKAFSVVRQGRWLVLCPFPNCNGAQMASYTDRRFYCVDCLSRAVGGRWIEVVWPEDPVAVESWLFRRPNQAKNWDTGEDESDILVQDAVELITRIPPIPPGEDN